MALSAIHGIMNNDTVLNNINTAQVTTDNQTAFDSFLSSAIDMYKETDDYQKAAEESEINFALGYSTSTHDLAIAQQKANVSLQYTVQVTKKVLEAYKELMNMQL